MANGMRAAADRAMARQASTGGRSPARPLPPQPRAPSVPANITSAPNAVFEVDGLPFLLVGSVLRALVVTDDNDFRAMLPAEKAWRVDAAAFTKRQRGARRLSIPEARMVGFGPRLAVVEVEHASGYTPFVQFRGALAQASTAQGWKARAIARSQAVVQLVDASKKAGAAAEGAVRAGALREAAKHIVAKAQIDRKTLDVATVARRDETVASKMADAESLRAQAAKLRNASASPGTPPDVSQSLAAQSAIAESRADQFEQAARYTAAQPLPRVGDVDPDAARRLAAELLSRAERLQAPALDVAASLQGLDPLTGVPFGMIYGGGSLGTAIGCCEKRDARGVGRALAVWDNDVGRALAGIARWDGRTRSPSEVAIAGLAGMLGADPMPVTAPEADYSGRRVNPLPSGLPPPPVPELICRNEVIAMGGVTKKVCRPQAEWDDIDRKKRAKSGKSSAPKPGGGSNALPKLPDLPSIPGGGGGGGGASDDGFGPQPAVEESGTPWALIAGGVVGVGVLGYLAFKS